MVTRKVVKEIILDFNDPSFNIFDPGSELPAVKIQNVLPGRWQFRTDTRDYGFNGQHIVQIEAVHHDYLRTASCLEYKYFDKMSEYAHSMSGHLSFATQMTCNLSMDKLTTTEYGCYIYSPSLSGYHPVSVAKNSRDCVVAARVELTHKF